MEQDKLNIVIELLKKERDKILEKVKCLDDVIDILRNDQLALNLTANNFDKTKYVDYFKAYTYKQKAIAILKAEKRFLQITEIINIAKHLEPGEDDAYYKSIGQSVYELKYAGVLISIKKATPNVRTYWGGAQWVDENGEMKPGYSLPEQEISKTRLRVVA